MAFPVLTPQEVAELIKDQDTLGLSGFTASGTPKLVTEALAAKAEREHAAGRPFKVNVYTGASTQEHADGALARANALDRRSPYQNTPRSPQAHQLPRCTLLRHAHLRTRPDTALR